jgi:hypothetical protein
MYQADDVAGLGLNEDALVLVALLAGGDYSVCPPLHNPPYCRLLTPMFSQSGLRGCGLTTAYALA